MKIKSLFDQYELDCAQAVLRGEYNLKSLSGKTIAISGSYRLVRAIALSLLVCNEEKALGLKLVLRTEQRGEEWESCPGIVWTPRDEAADLLVITDFYDCPADADSLRFKNDISRASALISELSGKKPEKTLLVTNTLCYGVSRDGLMFSEYESGRSDSLSCDLMRSVENLFFSASKQYGFLLTVMRAADLIADFSNRAELWELLNAAANGGELHLRSRSPKNSYIYINDLITALVFLLTKPTESVYNVCGEEMNLGGAELGAVFDSVCPECELTVSPNGRAIEGAAIDCTRIKRLGWQPKISAKDAVLMAVMSIRKSDGVFMFPDAYDGKLGAIQNVLLGFLMEVDRICRKHDIKYFLGGGSLLGAIRHKGFIPWDDDADVMMLRDDYERFLSVLPRELPDFVFIQAQSSDKASHFPFTKLRLDKTILATEFSARFSDLHNGVFLDVLAQDKTSKNKFVRKLHIKLTAQLRWLVLNKWRKTPVEANNRFVSLGANIIKAVFPLSVLEKAQNGIMKKYRNRDTGLLYDSMGRNVENGAFPESWLSEAVYVDFENTRLPVPKEYDKYLTYLYGDYNNMIPVSLRHVSHDIVQTDLGAYLDYHFEGEKKNC